MRDIVSKFWQTIRVVILFAIISYTPTTLALNTAEMMAVLSLILFDEESNSPPSPETAPTSQLGLTSLTPSAWDEQAVRRVLNVFAYGGHATNEQITQWANMWPNLAIEEMLTFAEHNPKLSPVAANEIYTEPVYSHGKLWDFSENFIASDSATHPIPPDSGNNLTRSQYSLNQWNFSGLYTLMVTTRGLNPFRQRIGMWETNYHMAVNLNTQINHHQMARYYDDIMEALEAGEPYQNVIAIAAASAAVAMQYGHRFNEWNSDTGECECNEDFAREIHQLFFGILGNADPLGIDNHENVTIKNTAKALTDMRVDWDNQLERYPEYVTFGTEKHYPQSLTLNILNNEISGANALERINNIAQVAIEHPESLENLPVMIISGLADQSLTESKKIMLRSAWQSMAQKDLLKFLQAYAISTLFHDQERVKFWTSAERHLLMANKLVLNNTEGIGIMYLYNPLNTWARGMEAEKFELFRPSHNVFGNQTPQEASDSASNFENNYNRYIWDNWQFQRFTRPDVFPGWEKDWSTVLPSTADVYRVDEAAEWLWIHFLNDDLNNFGPLEKAHVYSLLGSKRDFPFLMCLRAARLAEGITENSLTDLENDNTDRCGSWNNNFSQQELQALQGAYLTSDASAPEIQSLIAQIGSRELLVTSSQFADRQSTTQRIGAAIGFILSTPYIFAEEGY